MPEQRPTIAVQSVSAAELSGILKARAGLIVGPGIPFHSAVMGELVAHLADVFDVRMQDSYLSIGDIVLNAGASEDSLRAEVQKFFQSQTPDPQTSHVAHIRWTAVLSACLDNVFDEQFSREASRRALWQPATIVSDLRRPVPPRTVPVYKLLGSLANGDAAVSSPDLYTRSAIWPRICRAFADRLQGAPVVCLGMSALPGIFWQLFGVLTADPPSSPSAIVFLEDDPLSRDPAVLRMSTGRVRLYAAATEPGVLLSAVSAAEDKARQERLPFPVAGGADLSQLLYPYRELVSLVNTQVTSALGPNEVHQLHELLFEPSRPRWDAFVHDLDFRRDITSEALADLELLSQSPTQGSAACLIRGLAACGKTTVMKRLSLTLAKSGHIVLWLRPWFYQDTQAVLFDLFRKLRTGLPEDGPRPVVFMDDPLTFGTLTAHDVGVAADSVGVDFVLVASARSSDWETRDARDFVGRLQIMADFEVPDRLSEGEITRLPSYLQTLGVTAPGGAQTLVQGLSKTTARDLLATLYWSLPDTRKSITRSVKDEYFRLGDSAGLTKVVIGELHSNTGLLQDAYGLIAVSEHFRSPVPLEVLVAALDVPYSEWLDASGGESAAWGLFYSDSSDDGQTLSYHTRNAVVTEIIVRTLNAGELSHGGEFRSLRRLLAACTGSAPTYREFCVRVLVSTGIDSLEYDEGVELFDTAIAALPYADKTLVHHKGLWVKEKGGDPLKAIEVLNQALTTPNYPHASHFEADEHIYTSLAAASLNAMQLRVVSKDEGRRQVLAYLDRAQSRVFFNPNATHVEARLVKGLVDQAGPDDPDRNALLARALRSLDRALTLLRAAQSAPLTRVSVADDIAMLSKERDKLIGLAKPLAELQAEAQQLWDRHGRQDGFVLAARILYGQAIEADKGTTFFTAHSYCENVFETVRSKGVPHSRDLAEVALDIYYQWRIARRVPTSAGESIDWVRVKELATQIIRGTPTASDPLHEYLYGLALSHLGDWGQADAVFLALRRSGLPKPVLWARRDRFLGADGRPLLVQGTVRETGDQRYVYVESLKMDFRTDRGNLWPRSGEVAHVYIEFAFGGPTAVKTSA